jgi:hypothetical protein
LERGKVSESIWYAGYDAEGNPPHCRRLSRLPRWEQYGIGIDLAIAKIEGKASSRPYRHTLTEEAWWYWPELRPSTQPNAEAKKRGWRGWWMVHPRVERLAKRAHEYAEQRAREDVRAGKALPDERGHGRFGDLLMMHLMRLHRAAHRRKRREVEQTAWVMRTHRKEVAAEISDLRSIAGLVRTHAERQAQLAMRRRDLLDYMTERNYLRQHRGELRPPYDSESVKRSVSSAAHWIGEHHRNLARWRREHGIQR